MRDDERFNELRDDADRTGHADLKALLVEYDHLQSAVDRLTSSALTDKATITDLRDLVDTIHDENIDLKAARAGDVREPSEREVEAGAAFERAEALGEQWIGDCDVSMLASIAVLALGYAIKVDAGTATEIDRHTLYCHTHVLADDLYHLSAALQAAAKERREDGEIERLRALLAECGTLLAIAGWLPTDRIMRDIAAIAPLDLLPPPNDKGAGDHGCTEMSWSGDGNGRWRCDVCGSDQGSQASTATTSPEQTTDSVGHEGEGEK